MADANLNAAQPDLAGITLVPKLEAQVRDFFESLSLTDRPSPESMDQLISQLVSFDFELRSARLVQRIKSKVKTRFRWERFEDANDEAIVNSLIQGGINGGTRFESPLDDGINSVATAVNAQRNGKASFLKENPGLSDAEIDVTYWAQMLAKKKARDLDPNMSPSDDPPLDRWQRILKFGAFLLDFVDKFDEAIIYTMPWEELGQILGLDRRDLSGIDPCAMKWILHRSHESGLQQFLKDLNKVVDEMVGGVYTLLGIEPPQSLRKAAQLKEWRATFAEGTNRFLREANLTMQCPAYLGGPSIDNDKALLCSQKDVLLRSVHIIFPVKPFSIHELRSGNSPARVRLAS